MADRSKSAAIPENTGEITRPTAFGEFLRKMALTAETDTAESNGEAATQATVERILLAEEEDIWNAGDLANIGGRNLVGVEQEVTDYAVRFSKNNVDPSGEIIQSHFVYQDRGMYLLVNATILGLPDDNPLNFKIGQEIIWNTSAPDIVPKLIRFHELGRFPLQCVIRGTDLGQGRTYLRLKPVPRRAVRSS